MTKLKEKYFGKCPFRKVIKKVYDSSNNYHKTETIEEDFLECDGFNCMAFSYLKVGDVESYGCKRMKNE
jgi:hypothetical protein